MKTKILISIILIFALTFVSAQILQSSVFAEKFEMKISATLEGVEKNVSILGEGGEEGGGEGGGEHEAAEKAEEEAAEESTPVALVEEETASVGETSPGEGLKDRRMSIGARQEKGKEHAAAFEEKPIEPKLLATTLPVTGSMQILLIFVISIVFGFTLPVAWKYARERVKNRKS